MSRRAAPAVLFVLAMLVAFGGLTRAGQPTNPFDGDPDAIAEGQALFDAMCGGYCHATTEGETTDAPDLFDCEWWHGDTDADLYRVIADGVPDTRMQAFGGQFPEGDIWRFVAAIRAGSRCDEAASGTPEPAF